MILSVIHGLWIPSSTIPVSDFQFTDWPLEGTRVEQKAPGARCNNCNITFQSFHMVLNELISAESKLIQTQDF